MCFYDRKMYVSGWRMRGFLELICSFSKNLARICVLYMVIVSVLTAVPYQE